MSEYEALNLHRKFAKTSMLIHPVDTKGSLDGIKTIDINTYDALLSQKIRYD